MINNEHTGSLNTTVLLLWLAAAAIAPYESEGVYYALIGGNHVMHFRQSYWKKLVRGAIKFTIVYFSKLYFTMQNFTTYMYFSPIIKSIEIPFK